jgi:hypothetical protein
MLSIMHHRQKRVALVKNDVSEEHNPSINQDDKKRWTGSNVSRN